MCKGRVVFNTEKLMKQALDKITARNKQVTGKEDPRMYDVVSTAIERDTEKIDDRIKQQETTLD